MGLALAGAVQAATRKRKEKSRTCAACHGPDGNSATGDFPKLAGQHTLPDQVDAGLQNRQSARTPSWRRWRRPERSRYDDLAAFYCTSRVWSPARTRTSFTERGAPLAFGGPRCYEQRAPNRPRCGTASLPGLACDAREIGVLVGRTAQSLRFQIVLPSTQHVMLGIVLDPLFASSASTRRVSGGTDRRRCSSTERCSDRCRKVIELAAVGAN